MDTLSRFCCQNIDCSDYGKRGGENLSVSFRHGSKDQFRMLYCSTCKERFSERKGTLLFGGHLAEEKAIAILKHLAEGCGVRKTGRLVGVSKNTVLRYSRLAGRHAQQLHDECVAFSPSDPRTPARRKVVVRGEKGEKLRSR
jgi:hypothetical protein